MTQLEQAGRQTTVLTSAAVALVVSLAITISSMLIIPQLTSAPPPEVDRYAEAGRAWQAQRELESSHFRNRLHAVVQGEAEWQVRYEQTNPNR